MRKHFLILMLMALLPLAGWAQGGILLDNSYFKYGNYVYQVKHAPIANGAAGEAWLVGVRNGNNPVDATGKLCLPENGTFTINVLEDNYSLVVTQIDDEALRYNFDIVAGALENMGEFAGKITATSVVIPKTITTIQANTFVGYTNLKKISFEENSEVETIAGGAFTTTQLSTFDFSNCSKLTNIDNGLFVEDGYTNSYVTEVTLPEASEALINIGTAFKNLPNLTAINNLDKSLITTLVAESFSGDAKLETLALPATIETIAENAFQGSGVKNLTIDVTSMHDTGAGNIFGTSKDNLKTLTLKGVLSRTFKPGAFAGCENLESVTMNDATKPFVITGGTIGASAFEGCTKLATLTFNGITEGTIGADAFKGCTSLTSVVFNDITGAAALTPAVIGVSAFEGCTKLAEITFGDLTHVTISENAFKGCATNANATLTFSTLKDVEIAGTATGTGAFYNCTKLGVINFGTSENLTIGDFAFEECSKNFAVSSTAKSTLTFANAKNIEIGDNAFYSATATKFSEITFGDIEDDGAANTEFAANAFGNAKNLQTLTFGNLTGVVIPENTFASASVSLGTNEFSKATFGNLQGTIIEDGAFADATKLAIVSIGDVTENSEIGQGAAAVFPNLMKATIGTVEGDEATIAAKAFTFGNYTAASVNLAYVPATTTTEAAVKYLQNTDATPGKYMIDAAAFDFTLTTGAGIPSFVKPVVNIGEIKTTDAFAEGALKGDKISTINFKGNIVAYGLNKMIIVKSTTALELATLVFDGAIAQHGINVNAFAALPEVMTITFNGKMAGGAVDGGAFEGLVVHSHVTYAYNESDIDLTVNPFAKNAFKATAAQVDARIIEFSVVNAGLAAKFDMEDLTNGLLSDGTYAIYLAGYVEPVPPVVDLSFLVYPDLNAAPRTAWARWELGARVAEGVTGTLAAGTDLVIKRVQKIDGTHNAKITIYGTYTDEDDALNLASVYMVPLKAENGYYHIPGTNKTTLIVKVENNGADFTETSYKVECNHDDADDDLDWPAYNETVCTNVVGAKNGSIWPGLLNKELFVASQIMTNQQLVDKSATDPANAGGVEDYGYYHGDRDAADIDIYRTGATIAEDLYIMSDPSKNKGFRIAKSEITSTNNAYINTGWYYMLLKKYEGAAAAAHVVWMDDATEGEITGILTVKDNAKNVAAKSEGIYTLQGVRVSEMQKGQIYIVNGKKYIAK